MSSIPPPSAPPDVRYPDLEIEDDPRAQEREWRVKRISWVFLYGIILAAVLGFFGDGPASRVTARPEGADWLVSYERWLRRGAAEDLTVWLNPDRSPRSFATVRVNGAWASSMEIIRFEPAPQTQRLEAGGALAFYFALPAGDAPTRLNIQYKPRGWGPVDGQLAVNEGPWARVWHFVFP